MNSNEILKNTSETEKSSVEVASEVQDFVPAEQSNEVSQRLAADLEKAGQIVSDTARQIREDYVPMKGKAEANLEAPKTDSEKRLFENLGYDADTLAEKKRQFASMSSEQMYNEAQILTIKETVKFLEKSLDTLGKEDQKRLRFTINKMAGSLKTGALAGDPSRLGAIKSYKGSIVDYYNKGFESNNFDGLSKLYKKAGYKSGLFASGDYGKFQEDLLQNILTPEQQKTFKAVEKKADLESGATISGAATSFGSGTKTNLVSAKTPKEIIEKIAA